LRFSAVFAVLAVQAALVADAAKAQNLVTNPSFENYSHLPFCGNPVNPANFSSGLAYNWGSWSGTPDYFHTASGNIVDVNGQHCINFNPSPRSGSAHAGFAYGSSQSSQYHYREFVRHDNLSLSASESYEVEFWVKRAAGSNSGKIGIFFFRHNPFVGYNPNASPQIFENLVSTSGYQKVSGVFVPPTSGLYRFAIGAFNQGSVTALNYFFVDDVKISVLHPGDFITKDLKNIGTVAAHGLSVLLSKPSSSTGIIVTHYDGHPVPADPPNNRKFLTFTSSNPTPTTILLKWNHFDDPFFDGNDHVNTYGPPYFEFVHVGWQTNNSVNNILDMYWTDDSGQRIPGSNVYNIKPGWTYKGDTGWVNVDWGNDFVSAISPAVPITISDVHYAVLPSAIPLEDLNAENASLNAVLDTQPLPGGDSGTLNGWSIHINGSMYMASDLNLAIADFGARSHVMNVPDSFNITDVDIDLDISHTSLGDLCVTVEHGGTTVTLIQRPGDGEVLDCDMTGCCGCSQDNYARIILDDEGIGGAIEDQCVLNLSSPPNYTPNNPLSAFDGMNSAGSWTITVNDNAGGDVIVVNPGETSESRDVPGGVRGTAVVLRYEVTGPESSAEALDYMQFTNGAQGACCDPNGGCEDNVVEFGCSTERFYEGQTCEDVVTAGLCAAPSIPTVSEWGLVVLTLLLLIGAKIYFARRETATT